MDMKIGRRTVEITHPDKVLFPDDGLTKADLAEYYHKVSEWMLPHIKDRALTIERFPDGIGEDGFIQQEAADYFPDYVGRATLKRKDGSKLTHVTCDTAASLVYLANQGVVTFHMWLSTIDAPTRPDRLVFDLDPPGDDFSPVRQAARQLRDLLDELGLVPFVMTTGSKGMHVVVPIKPEHDFDAAREFAKDVVELLAGRHPDTLTTEQRKDKRKGRLYLDVFRIGYGQTGVAPYTVRPKPGAPVATPLDWDELGNSALDSQTYTVQNLFHRLGQKDDPWKGLGRHARLLSAPRKTLKQLLQDNRSDIDT